MKLTAQQVFDATLLITKIINEKRPLPLKGNYRLARLHAKLSPEFSIIAAKRDALITAYDHHEMVPGPKTRDDPFGDALILSSQFSVPPDKLDEFMANWGEIAGEEIEVDLQPIPLSHLNFGDDVAASITAAELITLGELIADDSAAAKAA